MNWHLQRLVVEGNNDKHTIGHLLRRHGFDFGDHFTTFLNDADGETEVLGLADVAIRGLAHVGIVVDADTNPLGRWIRYRDALRRMGLAVPDALLPEGLVVPGLRTDTTVGLWQMPDNVSAGKLEDFVATLVPAGDTCWPIAIDAVQRARSAGAPLRAIDEIKGQLHTWLAWRETPGVPIGVAITATALRDDSPIALQFVAWFRRVFPQ